MADSQSVLFARKKFIRQEKSCEYRRVRNIFVRKDARQFGGTQLYTWEKIIGIGKAANI